MNLRKFISGVSALTIAASAFAGMAVTASATTDVSVTTQASTTDTPITYTNGENGLTSYTFNGTASSVTYSTTNDLTAAETNDTLVYVFEFPASLDGSTTNSINQAIITVAGKKIVVNPSGTDGKGAWNSSGYYVNRNGGHSVIVTVTATLNANGQATNLNVAAAYNGSTTPSWNDNIPCSNASLANIILGTGQRGGSYAIDFNLTSFSATLKQATEAGAALSTFTYDENTTATTYNIGSLGTVAAGDQLVITYDLLGTADNVQYRAGIEIAGKDIWYNASNLVGAGGWSSPNYHLNFCGESGATATITITLNANGTAKSIAPIVTYPSGTQAGAGITANKGVISVTNGNISTIKLLTDDRSNNAGGSITLSNFSATLYKASSYTKNATEYYYYDEDANMVKSTSSDTDEGYVKSLARAKGTSFTVNANDFAIKKITIAETGNADHTAEYTYTGETTFAAGSQLIYYIIASTDKGSALPTSSAYTITIE